MSLNDLNAREVIQAIYPYLIIKRKQAEMFLEFQERVTEQNKNKRRHAGSGRREAITIEEWTIRHSYYQKILNLNQKGVPLYAR